MNLGKPVLWILSAILLARDGVLDGISGRIARTEAEFARARAALEATENEPVVDDAGDSEGRTRKESRP